MERRSLGRNEVDSKIVPERCDGCNDADMEGYFDSIPHDKLMACVRMRVVDGSVLRLIEQWLNAAVEEEGRQWENHTQTQPARNAAGRNDIAVVGEYLPALV